MVRQPHVFDGAVGNGRVTTPATACRADVANGITGIIAISIISIPGVITPGAGG